MIKGPSRTLHSFVGDCPPHSCCCKKGEQVAETQSQELRKDWPMKRAEKDHNLSVFEKLEDMLPQPHTTVARVLCKSISIISTLDS